MSDSVQRYPSNPSHPSSKPFYGDLKQTEVEPGTVRHSQVQPGTVRYSQVQPGTVRYSQVQPGTTRYSQVQPPCTARYNRGGRGATDIVHDFAVFLLGRLPFRDLLADSMGQLFC